MFQDEQTSPGARAIKLSEPMWTSFFELHTGPWRKSCHNMRPDTRAIEASSRPNRLKITLQNWGHPHTPLPALSRRLENCALPDRSRECGRRSSAPPSPAQCRAGLASYDTRRRAHPPHQFRRLARRLPTWLVATACQKRRSTTARPRMAAWSRRPSGCVPCCRR